MQSCCGPTRCETEEEKRTIPVCPSCGKKGKQVDTRTLWYLLKGKFQRDVVSDTTYYFCGVPDCAVVYYSDNSQFFTKDQVRVPVGQKELENPQVCYCFNFFTSDLREEIETTGKTIIPDFIRQKVKEKACACEIMNPQGSCCLGNVSQAVKKIEKDIRGF